MAVRIKWHGSVSSLYLQDKPQDTGVRNFNFAMLSPPTSILRSVGLGSACDGPSLRGMGRLGPGRFQLSHLGRSRARCVSEVPSTAFSRSGRSSIATRTGPGPSCAARTRRREVGWPCPNFGREKGVNVSLGDFKGPRRISGAARACRARRAALG